MLLWFSHPVVSDSLWSHGLQQARPLCPSLFFLSVRVCNEWHSCPNSQGSVWPFLCVFQLQCAFSPGTSGCYFSFFLFRDESTSGSGLLCPHCSKPSENLCLWLLPLITFMGAVSVWESTEGNFLSRVLWNQAEMTLSGTFLEIEPCLDFFLSLFFSPSFPWEQLLTSFPGNISL